MPTLPLILKNDRFHLEYNHYSGAMTRLLHPDDTHAMNWVLDQRENPWHRVSSDWGLGFVGSMYKWQKRWQVASSIEQNDSRLIARYQTDNVGITVERTFDESGDLVERYRIQNTGEQTFDISSSGIYTPFNDTYEPAEISLFKRCHAHIWTAHNVAWVNALRMGGKGPHLGMVLLEGSLCGYSIENRDMRSSSNIRGDIVLNPAESLAEGRDIYQEKIILEPGQSYTLAWKLFWHTGWDDFFDTLHMVPGFIDVSASRYSAEKGTSIAIDIPGINTGDTAGEIRIELKEELVLPDAKGRIQLPDESGLHRYDIIRTDGYRTSLHVVTTPAPRDLIRTRVRFIVDNQQVTDPSDPRDGAYVPFDTEYNRQILNPNGDRNTNEARERIGVGVLIAQYLQYENGNDTVTRSLERFARFVETRLLKENGDVLDSVGDTTPQRMYNFSWVAHFWLEYYKLTKEKRYLNFFTRTLSAYYALGGADFYAIGIPVVDGLKILAQAGMNAQHSELMQHFQRHAHTIMKRGLLYPGHEVIFEQSIVGPAAVFLLEMFIATGDTAYGDAAQEHLACLELFNGHQPDVRLNDIAIRHWDGYWFGRERLWGDTFPHYWSCITAHAFFRYGQVRSNEDYTQRARAIVDGNLVSFTPDGKASCALIYPLTVDNRIGRLRDPLANDQDWALVYYHIINHEEFRL